MDTRVLRELQMGQIWKTRTYFSEHNEPVKNFKIFFSLLTLKAGYDAKTLLTCRAFLQRPPRLFLTVKLAER